MLLSQGLLAKIVGRRVRAIAHDLLISLLVMCNAFAFYCLARAAANKASWCRDTQHRQQDKDLKWSLAGVQTEINVKNLLIKATSWGDKLVLCTSESTWSVLTKWKSQSKDASSCWQKLQSPFQVTLLFCCCISVAEEHVQIEPKNGEIVGWECRWGILRCNLVNRLEFSARHRIKNQCSCCSNLRAVWGYLSWWMEAQKSLKSSFKRREKETWKKNPNMCEIWDLKGTFWLSNPESGKAEQLGGVYRFICR